LQRVKKLLAKRSSIQQRYKQICFVESCDLFYAFL